jgi:glycosyltransferase involved in cell wall biosynthesis
VRPEIDNDLIPVSVIVFTLNEGVNLPFCMDSLDFTDDVVVVDSFSVDETIAIARKFGARVFQNEFQGFGSQRNWALENTNLKYEWALILDADERVTAELKDEIAGLLPGAPESVAAFMLKRRFYMWGKWLRYSSLYPTYVVRLIRRDRVRYLNRGHAETQKIDGELRELSSDLIDENSKGLHAWFERQSKYALEDARYELDNKNNTSGNPSIFSLDPLVRRVAIKRLSRRIPLRPFWYFMYSYIWRRGFLDGYAGFVFCYMRSVYQAMVVINKFDISRSNDSPSS